MPKSTSLGTLVSYEGGGTNFEYLTIGKEYFKDCKESSELCFLDDIGTRRRANAFVFRPILESPTPMPSKSDLVLSDLPCTLEFSSAEELVEDAIASKKADRFNAGKTQFSYMLNADVAMKGMCDVFTFGAEKYSRGNWKSGFPENEIMDSMLRHLTAYANGEVLDPESGLPHIDHVTCNAVFLATFGKRE